MNGDRTRRIEDLGKMTEAADKVIHDFMAELAPLIVKDVHKAELNILRQELRENTLPEELDSFKNEFSQKIDDCLRKLGKVDVLTIRIQDSITTLRAELTKDFNKRLLEGLVDEREFAQNVAEHLSSEQQRAKSSDVRLAKEINDLRQDILGLGQSTGEADESLRQEFSRKLLQQRSDLETTLNEKHRDTQKALEKQVAELRKAISNASSTQTKRLDEFKAETTDQLNDINGRISAIKRELADARKRMDGEVKSLTKGIKDASDLGICGLLIGVMGLLVALFVGGAMMWPQLKIWLGR
ncbi:MAG: hypothetical protein HY912_22340 [Desulfomonile tiedjei]|uniref:Uncharacterized protein n=1 Tax=Desulfomonile tiedjei TaxID=2358 RepID=A0A9D6V7P0_9BACT|nr:hypothetical protein [Desulfomonile tiedjei]